MLTSCVILTAVLNESLRMAPPTPGSFWRLVEQDTWIDGHLVPRGYEVGVCQYAIHHCPRYFPQPYEFCPDRFLNPKSSPIPAGAFIPFSSGPRSCPARKATMHVASVLLARLLWLGEFRPAQHPGENVPTPEAGLPQTPEYPLDDVFSADKKGPIVKFRLRDAIECP